MSEQNYRWSQKSLNELAEFYRTKIRREFRRAPTDRDYPSYQWLVDAGYGGLQYALREHHDMTVMEFFEEIGEKRDDGGDESDGYHWGIRDDDTIDELESYVRTLTKRRDLAETTVETKRSHLAAAVRAYEDIHGNSRIVARVDDLEKQPDEIERWLAVFDDLDEALGSDNAKLRYLKDIEQWFDHLQRRSKAAFNPVRGFKQEYRWRRETPDNIALSADQVSGLCSAARTMKDRLIVHALCAWGLRTSEVASLHHSQFELSGDDPHLAFDERKNGPGTVTLLFGVELVADRLDQLADRDDWNGYLLPSTSAQSGHVTPETVKNRFQALAERAEVSVRGQTPVPKMGRRYWYEAYLEATEAMLDELDVIAEEQGSADADVVARNYISDAKRREFRRDFMRETLSEAFENAN